MTDETEYVLELSSFTTMEETQVLIKALDDTLESRDLEAAEVRADVVELLSEIVFNAVEHGMTVEGAHAALARPERLGLQVSLKQEITDIEAEREHHKIS